MARSATVDTRDWYRASFQGFEESLNGSSESPEHALRKQALERFAATGFPTGRHESWRHTNVSVVSGTEFVPVIEPPTEVDRRSLDPYSMVEAGATELVFVDGHFNAALSTERSLPGGVRAMSLAAALQECPELALEHLARSVPDDGGFTALNTAFLVTLPKSSILPPAAQTVSTLWASIVTFAPPVKTEPPTSPVIFTLCPKA